MHFSRHLKVLTGSGFYLFVFIVFNCGLDSIFCQHGAVKLDRRKSQVRGNVGVLNLNGIFNSHSFKNFSGIRATSNSGSTTECLKHGFFNSTICFVDLNLELHDITTGRCTNKTSSDSGRVFVKGSNISGVRIMVENVFVISETTDSLDSDQIESLHSVCGCDKRSEHL